MKTPLLALASVLASCALLSAQSPVPGVVPSTAVSARDGFTRGSTTVVFTRNGVSQKVEKEVVLENGLRVQPDGSVTLLNGEKASLGNNRLLTLQGAFEDVALTQQGTAPITTGGAPMKTKNGEAATDGIRILGTEAWVIRNGASERLTKELRLDNGTRVHPNGSVTLADGKPIVLKANQVLTLDGAVRETADRQAPR